MKRYLLALLWSAWLLALTAGCGKTPVGPSSSPESTQQEAPLHLERLTVEFAVDGEPDALMTLAGRMPEKLQTALAQAGVEVERVQVTLGASPAVTAQALRGGGVDVAILSAEGYVQAGEGGVPLLADAVGGDETASQPGESALLCAAPTTYGRALARRIAGGSPLTWEELRRARWGVLARDADLGHRYLSLWLADHYEGNTLTDLPAVDIYESYEELLRAAAREELDIFPCTKAALGDWAAVWVMDTTRSDEAGQRGFGRGAPLEEEVLPLGETARRLGRLAVVRDDTTLTGAAFSRALQEALSSLGTDDDFAALAGCTAFAPMDKDSLNPLRRLVTLGDAAG